MIALSIKDVDLESDAAMAKVEMPRKQIEKKGKRRSQNLVRLKRQQKKRKN